MHDKYFIPYEPDSHRRLVKKLYGLLFVVIAIMWLSRHNGPLYMAGKLAFAISGVLFSYIPRRGKYGLAILIPAQMTVTDWILTGLYAVLFCVGLFVSHWGELASNLMMQWIAGGIALFFGSELIARHSRGKSTRADHAINDNPETRF